MLTDKMERNLIQKMAQICENYVEPFDVQDSSNSYTNRKLQIQYEVYKNLLMELWEN